MLANKKAAPLSVKQHRSGLNPNEAREDRASVFIGVMRGGLNGVLCYFLCYFTRLNLALNQARCFLAKSAFHSIITGQTLCGAQS